jgi:hypothetical protein
MAEYLKATKRDGRWEYFKEQLNLY